MLVESITGAVSRITLCIPPIRGVGFALEYLSRAFSFVGNEVTTRFDGSLITASPNSDEGRRLLFTARYRDREERSFVRSVLRPGDYAIDLGANIGLYSLLMGRLVGPAGRVTAIEAEPRNAARLRRNVLLNGYNNIVVVEKGAADDWQTLRLHLSSSNDGMHSFVADEGIGDIEVQCEPLSSLILPRKPRLLKIDIEGFEFPVLARYFAETASDLLPEFMVIEDWEEIRRGDVEGLCRQNGYRLLKRVDANLLMSR